MTYHNSRRFPYVIQRNADKNTEKIPFVLKNASYIRVKEKRNCSKIKSSGHTFLGTGKSDDAGLRLSFSETRVDYFEKGEILYRFHTKSINIFWV